MAHTDVKAIVELRFGHGDEHFVGILDTPNGEFISLLPAFLTERANGDGSDSYRWQLFTRQTPCGTETLVVSLYVPDPYFADEPGSDVRELWRTFEGSVSWAPEGFTLGEFVQV